MSTQNQAHLIGPYRKEELVAAATVTPCMLVEETSAGLCQAHSTEGGIAARAFAAEDALQGNTLDDDYSAGDRVQINVEEGRGNEVQALLKVGENVAINELLISAGDGTLISENSVSSGVTIKDWIGAAREAKDLSGSGAATSRIRVWLL